MGTTTKLYEAMLLPYRGRGLEEWEHGVLTEVDWVADLDAWVTYMDRNYEWRWAKELDGLIRDQDGGRPYCWKPTSREGDWDYGLLYVKDVEA